jgi:glycosyltransferase involved in cell wall biosynthesis
MKINLNNKVGFDVRTFKIEGGSRVYGQNLLKHFSPDDCYLFGIDTYPNFSNCYPTKIKLNSVFRLVYENIIIPQQVQKLDLKIFHGLKGVAPLFGNFKKVITVHDIIAFIYPESMKFKDVIYWKYLFPIYLKRADHIICISEYTKQDIIKRFNISPNRVSVVYHGFEPKQFKQISRSNCVSILNKLFRTKKINYSEDNQYLLNVNTVSPRKNITRLIQAFNLAKDKNKSLELLIVGKLGWKYEDTIQEYNESPYKDSIHFLDYVSDQELNALYNLSFVFIYPSLYEGFGLPILEAQASMTPVILSNASCLPEIAQDSALYIDPLSINSIAEAITELASDTNLQRQLQSKGFENIKRFSWEKCAIETAEIYSQIQKN